MLGERPALPPLHAQGVVTGAANTDNGDISMNAPKRLQDTRLPPGRAESSWEYMRRETFLKGRKHDEDQGFHFASKCNAYKDRWRPLQESPHRGTALTPPGYGANPTR